MNTHVYSIIPFSVLGPGLVSSQDMDETARFIYLITVLLIFQEYFAYRTAVSIMVRGNRAEPRDKPMIIGR